MTTLYKNRAGYEWGQTIMRKAAKKHLKIWWYLKHDDNLTSISSLGLKRINFKKVFNNLHKNISNIWKTA